MLQWTRVNSATNALAQWRLHSNELTTTNPASTALAVSGSQVAFSIAVSGGSPSWLVGASWSAGRSTQTGDRLTIELAAGALRDAAGNAILTTPSNSTTYVLFGARRCSPLLCSCLLRQCTSRVELDCWRFPNQLQAAGARHICHHHRNHLNLAVCSGRFTRTNRLPAVLQQTPSASAAHLSNS